MRLDDEPFGRMKDGEKTFELRINDEKRRLLKVGDEIEFVRRGNPDDTLRTKVFGLLIYGNFSDLINDTPAAWLGYEDTEKEYLKASMYEVYPKEEEDKYGVVGIRLGLIEEENQMRQ